MDHENMKLLFNIYKINNILEHRSNITHNNCNRYDICENTENLLTKISYQQSVFTYHRR